MSGPYPILFEVEIPNFGLWMHLWMFECHLPFLGHCDLDLPSRIIVSRAYLLHKLR